MVNSEFKGKTEGERRYRTSVPMMNLTFSHIQKTEIVRQLKELRVERIFLALGADSIVNETREQELNCLRENCKYLQSEGFEVGAWLWTFLLTTENAFVKMKAPDGNESRMTVCPTDAAYRKLMAGFLQEIACTGVDLIMFDDDYRYGFQDMGFGCVCENHVRMIEAEVGAVISPHALKKALLCGGKNKIRTAFLHANGKALEDFAAEMRKAVDAVSPHTRMGFCSCISSWDLDGTHPDRIAVLLAGNTKPFYRLIGAPYWAVHTSWGNRLGDVIELERAEAARRKNKEIEIFSEGDTYPRPRFATPASFLECFDTALCADGGTDGILKYMMDYTAEPSYETGYYEAAKRNLRDREAIGGIFQNKHAVGIRVYDRYRKYEDLMIPESIEQTCTVQEAAFSASARFLVANSLPTVYEGTGVCGIAFGEDVKDLPAEAFERGLILDLSAACILTRNGTDVGLASVGDAFCPKKELFCTDGSQAALSAGTQAFRLELVNGAKVLSKGTDETSKPYPLSYSYKNKAGAQFLVYAMNGYFADQGWFRSYYRARQIAAFIFETGEKLPVYCPGNPEVYILAKENNGSLSVGLWNLFPDPVFSPCIQTYGNFESVVCIRCEAEINADRIRLSDIPPFGFASIELPRKECAEDGKPGD